MYNGLLQYLVYKKHFETTSSYFLIWWHSFCKIQPNLPDSQIHAVFFVLGGGFKIRPQIYRLVPRVSLHG